VSRRQQVLVLVGVVALAVNLRPAAVSVGPVLGEIRDDLSMSATMAGFVATLPVLCFAAFGALAPWAARRVGMHRTILGSLGALALGLALRSAASSTATFIAASVVALAGMATANVLLPPLVKRHFPDRIGLITGVYTTVLSLGLTLAGTLTAPIADAAGGWRAGLAIWAGTAVLAALPWLGLVSHDSRPVPASHGQITARRLLRSGLAWSMAIFFGCQSLQAYVVFGWLPQIFRDAGFSANEAGLLLGLTTATSIPLSLALPSVAARLPHQRVPILALCATYVVGYVGLIVAPVEGAALWAILIGAGTGIFPLALLLIGLRARTSEGTAALSGFTQSVGYLLAAVGPVSVGAMYDATHAWTWPLVLLIATVIPLAVTGWIVGRPRYVEDEIERRTISPTVTR
jgi:CP family cyanate transporter-like MFS transporter